jgi:hypothetical protein
MSASATAVATSWRRRTRPSVSKTHHLGAPSSGCGRDTTPTAAHFARAALHAADVLAKASKEKSDPSALAETALYALRTFRVACALEQGRAVSKLRQLAVAAEDTLVRGDASLACELLEPDGPHGPRFVKVLSAIAAQQKGAPGQPLCAHRPPASATPPAPPPGIAAERMRTCVLKPSVASGVEVPVLGFGTGIFYSSDEKVGVAITRAAAELGYRHFDCAEGYHNEALVGASLARSGVPRSQLFLASKLSDVVRPSRTRARTHMRTHAHAHAHATARAPLPAAD